MQVPLVLGAVIVFAASAASAGASGGGAPGRGGLLVLLADNRILRVSAAGKVELARRLEAETAHPLEAGRMLALAAGGRVAYALVRGSRRDALALVDVSTLAIRRRIPLDEGIRYRGVLVGPHSHRLYLYGNRPGIVDPAHHLRAQSAVVTILTPSGKTIATRVVRPAAGHSWWVYWGALSRNERRLYLSYHGGCTAERPRLCTTGADRVELDGVRLRPCTGSTGPGGIGGCMAQPHGIVEPLPDGRLIVARGESGIAELDQTGKVLRAFRGVSRDTHLMDFALDASRGLVYTSSCDGTIRRLVIGSGAVSTLGRVDDCGIRTALGPQSTVAIAVATSGYPGAALEAKLVLVSRTRANVVATLPLRANPLDLLAVEG